MIVKICGITREEDAVRAVDLGATALGFIFWPGSARQITPQRARAVAESVPDGVLKVGVFVNATDEEIERTAEAGRLTAIQLHGDESPEFAMRLTRRVIKALALEDDEAAFEKKVSGWRGRTLLLDAHDPVKRGGTGRSIDWERAARVARRHEVILAGGLHAGNVAEAVRIVRPAGIDVSSGVERAPGVKDPAKLAALFEALAEVEVRS